MLTILSHKFDVYAYPLFICNLIELTEMCVLQLTKEVPANIFPRYYHHAGDLATAL